MSRGGGLAMKKAFALTQLASSGLTPCVDENLFRFHDHTEPMEPCTRTRVIRYISYLRHAPVAYVLAYLDVVLHSFINVLTQCCDSMYMIHLVLLLPGYIILDWLVQMFSQTTSVVAHMSKFSGWMLHFPRYDTVECGMKCGMHTGPWSLV